MRSTSEEGSYLRLVDFLCITQLWAESNAEEEKKDAWGYRDGVNVLQREASVAWRGMDRLVLMV